MFNVYRKDVHVYMKNVQCVLKKVVLCWKKTNKTQRVLKKTGDEGKTKKTQKEKTKNPLKRTENRVASSLEGGERRRKRACPVTHRHKIIF